jgi:hypothetical protein
MSGLKKVVTPARVQAAVAWGATAGAVAVFLVQVSALETQWFGGCPSGTHFSFNTCLSGCHCFQDPLIAFVKTAVMGNGKKE